MAAGDRNLCLLMAECAEGIYARYPPLGIENSGEIFIKEMLNARSGLAYKFRKLSTSEAFPLVCLEASLLDEYKSS